MLTGKQDGVSAAGRKLISRLIGTYFSPIEPGGHRPSTTQQIPAAACGLLEVLVLVGSAGQIISVPNPRVRCAASNKPVPRSQIRISMSISSVLSYQNDCGNGQLGILLVTGKGNILMYEQVCPPTRLIDHLRRRSSSRLRMASHV